jgi:hypothetical protein
VIAERIVRVAVRALRIRVSVGKRGLFLRGLVAWYGGEHVMRTRRITGMIHTNEAESD